MSLEIDRSLNGIKDHFNHLEVMYTGKSEYYIQPPEDTSAPFVNNSNVHLSAYYLPQFHRLEVNDVNWGSGFTEWTNVTRAHPYFPGHLQPHLPADLGFYDLENTDTLKRQVQLARHYGISSFCFYYYWFGGKKIMEGPIRQFLNDTSLDLQFSLCWANENWTRRWDGENNDIILQQPHSFDHDKRFIYDILPYLADSRYVRINGRPIFIVYRPELMGSHLSKTLEHWKKTVSDAGLGELLIFRSTFGIDFDKQDLRIGEFDGIVQFPPHGHWKYIRNYNVDGFFNKKFSGSIGDYDHAREYLLKQHENNTKMIPGALPAWDNTARKRSTSRIYINSNPLKYQHWLEAAIKIAKNNDPYKGLVFINAWNEWAEGAHIEPCRWYGHAHLHATRQAIINTM